MDIDETYNIHKKINCVIPFFKSKRLCKKGIHNYRIAPLKDINKPKLKCCCCGKEIDLIVEENK